MADLSRLDIFRIEALRAAALRTDLAGTVAIEHAAGQYVAWLDAPAVQIIGGWVAVADQADPARRTAIHRNGPNMAAVIKDSQIATYGARTAADARGFAVPGAVVLTTDDDTAQAVCTRVDNPDDGSSAFTAIAPGVVTLTWTAGADSLVDVLNVTPGDAVTISGPDPVVTDQ